MNYMTALVTYLEKTPIGVEADLLVTDDRGQTFAVHAEIAGNNMQVGGEDSAMEYLTSRFTHKVFSQIIRRAIERDCLDLEVSS